MYSVPTPFSRISSSAVMGTPPFCAESAWLSTLTRSVGAVSASDSTVPAPSPHTSAQKPGLAFLSPRLNRSTVLAMSSNA